jgi:hypothetical protein
MGKEARCAIRVNGPVTESAVREAMRATALVELKVVAFSATHTAVKWAIPKAARARTASSVAVHEGG